MPRIARVVITDYPHHITQRGNYKQTTFQEGADFKRYLVWLEEYRKKHKLNMLAFCLMPNHIHVIAIPEEKDSLAKVFNTCHMRYSQYFNKKNNAVGHLWQGRFYSCALNEQHLYEAVRYVENNPVRAGLVEKAWNWEWSSAAYHLMNKNEGHMLIKLEDINKFIKVDSWEKYLKEKTDDKIVKQMKANTLTGRPSGNDSFVEKIEKMLNTRLRALPVGRQRKKC
jgi:putative transposase